MTPTVFCTPNLHTQCLHLPEIRYSPVLQPALPHTSLQGTAGDKACMLPQIVEQLVLMHEADGAPAGRLQDLTQLAHATGGDLRCGFWADSFLG